jgi:hypothetical protein
MAEERGQLKNLEDEERPLLKTVTGGLVKT